MLDMGVVSMIYGLANAENDVEIIIQDGGREIL